MFSSSSPTLPLSGYILAGGRSSRMGKDKALLELAGKPLIAHAVTKLRRICTEVHILSGDPALAAFAPLVPDLHPNCGPIGGIEAALAHSTFDWNIFLPIDVPFIPTAFLDHWVRSTLADGSGDARIALFTIDGIPQPTLLLLHREVAPSISQAVARGHFKLFPGLEQAGRELAKRRNLKPSHVFRNETSAQALWFANLNTPEDFAQAEANIAALDT